MREKKKFMIKEKNAAHEQGEWVLQRVKRGADLIDNFVVNRYTDAHGGLCEWKEMEHLVKSFRNGVCLNSIYLFVQTV